MKILSGFKSASFAAAIALMSLGPFYSQAQAAPESSMARVDRTKLLRVGVASGSVPYYKKNFSTGEWEGFGPDFARDLAKDLGVKIEFVETTWGNSVLDLQSNKIDVMFALTPTPAREKMIGFSAPLFDNTYVMLCKSGYPDKSWEQFNSPEAKITVDLGSSMDNFATAKLPNASFSRLESVMASTMLLQAGRADCQVLTVLLAMPIVQKMPGVVEIQVPQPALAAPVSIGVQFDEDPTFKSAINKWVAKERRSGAVKRIILDNMQKLAGVAPESVPSSVKFE
ncbi:transporter substrate-binding domain-containing protein [Pseudomonas syringae]|uniref:transporter substrate-binding domain-containing protein n=1 Tax=Pseudomonas syringae TaxID=317 RepID=UPI00020987F4|nr:transporter substrate-binding domain-containing protein [Pseudomonas syringae]EGH71534.1 extracellular solute-binding protein family 3 [Pseudomonas syringae pv. aceris str. M302273]